MTLWWRRQDPPERIDQDWEVVGGDEDDEEEEEGWARRRDERIAVRVLTSPLVVTVCLGVAQQACNLAHADWRIQLALTLAVYLARSRHPSSRASVVTTLTSLLLSSTFSGRRV